MKLLSLYVLITATLCVRAAVPCTIVASGGDDAPVLALALASCRQVLIPKDTTLSIRTALNTTNVKNTHLSLQGTIKYYEDLEYWGANAFPFEFQNVYTFWLLGGKGIVVDGGGVIDGNGQFWWDGLTTNSSLVRPIPLTVYQGDGVIIRNITMKQAPFWFNLVHTSKNVVYSDITIRTTSNGNKSSNTDGWDTYRSNRVAIINSDIINSDDCVSFKPNSTNILVSNLNCTGSHGISVGSLGQYPQYIDIVENVTVRNVNLTNASNGVRIKVWAGANRGSGRVNNILYENTRVNNVDNPLVFDQCYMTNATACAAQAARVDITNVTVRGITGTSSGSAKSLIASLICSPGAVCENIRVDDFSVEPPEQYKPGTTKCSNLDVQGNAADLFDCASTV
ncbi:pectin lyase fold/virulence factor [Auriculariales sp. MPI-PUGE-AT-0066]|nr:pectin lyase fold/virulence factor [Auriculariales sp. MPI-PUGE-AT-0066]